MNARFPCWGRGAFLVAQLIGAGVTSLCAAESAAADGFEKVRKEIEATKTERAQAAPTGAGLSSAAPPDWQGPATVPPFAASPLRKATARETNSSHWLVEAMNRTDSSPSVNGVGDPRGRPGDDLKGLPEKNTARNTGAEKAATGADLRELRPLAGEAAARDPFARFLGGWMTPQDYALLKPVAAGESSPRAANRDTGSGSPSFNGRTPELSTSIRTSGGAEPPKKNAAPPAPRENPYLQVLAPSAIAPGAVLAAPKPPIFSAPRPAAATNVIQPVTTSPPPKGPDFPAAIDDEKYFKQLKRF